ncbi:phage tail protein [Pseudomonas fluorescens]|uniref:phage tail-collar fiber domain-containing protein n=1 Tax=Pseudomonas fluorescens TaxID=294 RepID=UPI00068ECDD4|nr:phage tail protein [Pseudomonas fluorescens]
MADYYTLLTNAGIAYETACKAAGTPIKLTQISVGDGGGSVYNPAATATALKREVWRGPLNALFQDEKNPSWLLAEVTIPPDVGGWYVREAGLWTDTGILYAIVKYPESFKPVLATSGSGKEFYIRSIFETSNASLVTLLIDDTVVKATRAWVMSYLAEELGKLDGKQSVRVAASSNIVLNGAQQIDGVAVIAGDRVLVANQTLAKDNGLWIVANGDWVRASDANSNAKVTPGLTVMVEEGTANGDSLWHLTTNAPITLGTTALTFKMLAGRTGIAAGTYKSLTVDEYGRATAGANPETLAGFGIKDSYTKAEVEALIAKASALPVGSIVAFPVDAPPPGFLELDNSVKSSATYPDLSAYLGGKFNKGDEGTGNFRLPETRGEFLRGWDHGRGVDAGRGLGSWQADDNKSHAHTVTRMQAFANATGSNPSAVVVDNGNTAVITNFAAGFNSSGGAEARPRNIAVMWCIKAWNAPVNQGTIDVAALAKEVERLKSAVPIGAVLAFPTGIVAPGYLELDGSVQSIATYPDLAAYLGTTYNKGNEGAGNFRLPESRGEFLRGWDHGRGVDAGRGVGTTQAEAFAAHNHRYFDGTAATFDPAGNWQDGKINGAAASISTGAFLSPIENGSTMQMVNAANTVNAGGAETRPRNLAVMWCIKAWNAPVNQGGIDIAVLSEQLQQLSLNGPIAGDIRNARVSIPVAASTATFTASEMVLGDVNGKRVVISNFNQSINLSASVKGLGTMDVGAAPVNGFVAMYALYNPASRSTGIIAVNTTAAIAPKLLAGVAPDGYTFSALLSILPTNASAQFAVAEQVERQVFYGTQVLSTTVPVLTLTGLSISAAVPLNAKSVSGNFQGTVSANGYSMALAGSAAAIGLQTFIVNFSGAGGGSFLDVPLLSPQTLFYRLSSAGTFSAFSITTNSYRF